MNMSMGYLRQFSSAFRDGTTRIYFPDNRELAVARTGQTMDPSAGRVAMEAKFVDGDPFRYGYLTKQNAAWAMLGVNIQKWSPADLTKPDDTLYLVAYPSFNPREELAAVYELYERRARDAGTPIVIFNGELDRVRGGYYPGLFFPGIAKLSAEFIPKFTAAYYIHNFKGTRPGALFRCYPGPWQVLRRNPVDPEDMRLIWEGETMPTLRQVSLEILPSNL